MYNMYKVIHLYTKGIYKLELEWVINEVAYHARFRFVSTEWMEILSPHLSTVLFT